MAPMTFFYAERFQMRMYVNQGIPVLWIVWIPVWYQAAIRAKMEFPDYGSHSVLLPPRLKQSLELPGIACTDLY